MLPLDDINFNRRLKCKDAEHKGSTKILARKIYGAFPYNYIGTAFSFAHLAFGSAIQATKSVQFKLEMRNLQARDSYAPWNFSRLFLVLPPTNMVVLQVL